MRAVAGSLALAFALSCAPAPVLAQQGATGTAQDSANRLAQGTIQTVHLDQHARLMGTTCHPTHVSFSGRIKTDGPAFVTYRWLRSDGTHKDGVLQFDRADGRAVSTAWDQTSTASGWVQLIVLSPKHVETAKAHFWVHCGTS